MKTTIKLFLCSIFFLGAVLNSSSLQAQNLQGPSQLGEPSNTQEYQVRWFALQLCHDFYVSHLGANYSKLKEYQDNIETQLVGVPAYNYGQVEKYVLLNPQAALSQRYIKCQAVIAFPVGFDFDATALSGIQDELNSIAAEITAVINPHPANTTTKN